MKICLQFAIAFVVLLIFLWLDFFPTDLPGTLQGSPQTLRSIVSCNIRGFPLINGQGYMRRLLQFLDMCKDCDVIALQEVWSPYIRRAITRHLHGWNIVCKRFPVSGLLLATRLPVSHVRHISFASAAGTDRLVNKGILCATVGNTKLGVIHMQDQDWSHAVHQSQLQELYKLQDTFVVGDFNCLPTDLRGTCVTSGRATCDGIEVDFGWAKHHITGSCKQLEAHVADHVPIMFTLV